MKRIFGSVIILILCIIPMTATLIDETATSQKTNEEPNTLSILFVALAWLAVIASIALQFYIRRAEQKRYPQEKCWYEDLLDVADPTKAHSRCTRSGEKKELLHDRCHHFKPTIKNYNKHPLHVYITYLEYFYTAFLAIATMILAM